MTTLHDLLDQVADRAPVLDNLADRTLTRASRRRRRRLPVALVAATSAAGLIVALALGVPTLIAGGLGSDDYVVGSTSGQLTVHFPAKAPALPAKGVGPVRLAYLMSCKGPDGRARDCSSWRVMTATGQHYRVDDGPDATTSDGGGGVLLSPDGRRLAYLRADGSFVLRDLESGRITTLFHWNPKVLTGIYKNYAWSPDGRWLLVVPGSEACLPVPVSKNNNCSDIRQHSMLVDTTSGQTVRLGDGDGAAYGLTDGDALFPFDGVAHAKDMLPLLDHDGQVKGELPGLLMPGKKVDGMLASISPDGSKLAVITFPKDKPSDKDGGVPLVTLVDVKAKRILHSARVGRDWQVWDAPRFLGWTDDTTVLIATGYPKGHIPAGPGESWPANVDSYDVETGTLQRVLRLPDEPAAFSIASGLS